MYLCLSVCLSTEDLFNNRPCRIFHKTDYILFMSDDKRKQERKKKKMRAREREIRNKWILVDLFGMPSFSL